MRISKDFLTMHSVPVVMAGIAFVVLSRRHKRKQRAEDANDPHKSLDFGLGEVQRGVKGKKGTAGSSFGDIDLDEKRPTRGGRQMSMDMISPYLLPPELQQSRESLHSLSRTIHQQEDPYRPVSQYVAEAASRSATPTRLHHDGASMYTASSGAPSRMRENYTTELLPNAAAISRTPSPSATFVPPPRQNSLPQHILPVNSEDAFLNPLPQIPRSPLDSESIQFPAPAAQLPRKAPGSGLPNGLPNNPRPNVQRPDSDLALSNSPPQLGLFNFSDDTPAPVLKSNDYGGPFMDPIDFDTPAPLPPVRSAERPALESQDNVEHTLAVRQSPPAGKSLPASPRPDMKHNVRDSHVVLPPQPEPQQAWFEDGSDYGEGFKVTPPSPGREKAQLSNRYSMDVPPEEFVNAGLGAPGFDARRLSMGFRPLPPNEVTESDDPEIRANRIRSFYKEYFDESKPAPQGQYYEDYDAHYYGNGGYDDGNYYDETPYYDPGQNNFVMPFAQPVTRRAMTPPPQTQRFMGQRPRQGSMGGMSMSGMSVSGMSMGGRSMGGGMGPPRMPPGPRAYSSASGRMPAPRRGRAPPPPAALNTLPTPSMLRDDSFALMGATDFAPPLSYKERQRGRSESPLGERRAYSPSVPAYKPLASAYDELAAMPSP